MKKNNTMRVAAGLAVAALLSTCLVSGTFAKYTTSKESSDNATVAAFGVKITPTSDSMFKAAYAKTENITTEMTNSVESTAKQKLVAPGTAGALTSVKLSGSPEVAVRVSNEATVDLGEDWKDAQNAYYCPLEVTVGSGQTQKVLKGTDSSYNSIDDFESAIKTAIDAYSAEYAPNTDLSNKTDACPVVSWKWEFEGNDDTKDTDLGDATTAKATVSIKVKTIVTQID